ncbi:uncharacterized protein BCR38DRAFT_490295 [Pseudomassariella vexata]|uniref:Uncharacterized protein n=1 Tax=Pseudomassariella vexata TaxID=1141098 RepID=A0A1Y2DCC9_9PEZI|nr:uncharacterized protein BCR38DRAFT_490295 [Pseudomassariella vexata]ORY56847.1 hypothetical protein BCR38DRAFT_490295 [Pseudomassariella vexata]
MLSHKDCSVFWVPAVDAISFENAYREVGQALGVRLEDDKADVKLLVKAALEYERIGSWLLVVDNADDLKLVTELSKYLPSSRKGSVLFTTRNHATVLRLDSQPESVEKIREMSRHEALNLLKKNAGESLCRDSVSTETLLDFLADFPLAISQASTYMFQSGTSTKLYLAYYQSSDETKVRLLSKDFQDRGRYELTKNPVATTWLILFDHITRDQPLAAEYLRFMCFLAEKDIPKLLLPPSGVDLEEEAIGTLKGYAFITQRDHPNSYDMHRLVRLATRGEHPDILHSINNLANILDSQGKYEEAERKYRQTLELREKVLGREHPGTLDSINNLANVLDSQGKYKESEKTHRQTPELREKVLGREHPDTLKSMNNLANVLDSQGKYEEAEEAEQTLELDREHPTHLVVWMLVFGAARSLLLVTRPIC